MYKVFIENRSVIFFESVQEVPVGMNVFNLEGSFDHWLLPLVRRSAEGTELYIICPNSKEGVKELFSSHKKITAAGGVVSKDEMILIIERHGLWDLPKGKVEKTEMIEEAAVREVEEECGIEEVRVVKHLIDTHHTYEHKGKKILKRTCWFSMSCSGEKIPSPQLEEGITKAEWCSLHELDKVFKNTYPSIAEVLKVYLSVPLK
jgi:8-oxo-dGTP pyrophosphatase MutT (NUDIX family)